MSAMLEPQAVSSGGTVDSTDGHDSSAKLNVPKDWLKGSHILVTTISDGKNMKTSKSAFQVV